MRRNAPGRRWGTCAAAVLAALLVTACATDDAPDPDDPSPVTPGVDTEVGVRPDLSSVLPDDRGDPPDALIVEDLVVGDGDEAGDGDQLTVHFIGANWTTGEVFDATWDRDRPYTFDLGAGRVIEGWERGLPGMRVGGRRLLVVPAEDAYGERGALGLIGPGETLVFVVDLLDVRAVGG